MGSDGYLPLFETRVAKGRLLYWLYAVSMVVGLISISVYRWTHFPSETGLRRWGWIGISMAELWFIFYWLITQTLRHRPVYRYAFKDRLSERYEEVLPGVDMFVCTADAEKEPPAMVMNTVLSMMAYDYPPEKLHVYLSDDGGSEVMFYALLEASRFAGRWLPFRRRFRIEPPAPTAYFSSSVEAPIGFSKEWREIKKLYEEMKDRIDECTKVGRVPDEARRMHRAFEEWDISISSRDHRTILEIVIDGRDANTVDFEGMSMPTLVYLAREKRPGHQHNFKAGAMNALIRVSERISNSPIILNVDCDQYSNNSESIRNALCFFMDEEQSRSIAYVQFPQYCDNVTKNDLYGSDIKVINEVEHQTADANGGPLYIGSGCFHRRDVLCGKKFDANEPSVDWKELSARKVEESAEILVQTCKILASCTYEENTSWGNKMGLKYGCSVEDVITGLSIQCRGWRSVSYNTERRAFYGVAPTTLMETLIQHTRWSNGNFQIFLSKYNSLVYGHGKMPLKLRLSYCCYNLWAANCLATLYYVLAPPFYLLNGGALFPQLSSRWVLAYMYVFMAKYAYSLGEFVWVGGTMKGWCNEQRIWLYKRVTSYLYGFHGAVMKVLGFSEVSFVITAKRFDDDEGERYRKEMMEFGVDSTMFVVLAAIALFNLLALVSVVCKNIFFFFMVNSAGDAEICVLQVMLIGMIVGINLPVFEGMFVRKDKGCIPASVMYKAIAIVGLAYLSAIMVN
ncbi:cellulose synthase-like protein E6 isoform X2 [Andrographis paniculata]|uniref:cellulose synthase-like protein E6 isoform X2 n=1 Tax=Andrographis paniculata TaxID=175694 RepID=UPI0021E7DA1A|nr:cellulose synthase-like protein E6 isoform X2 [Andrographis paniculata]